MLTTLCVLLGGFSLRYAILTTPPELLARHPNTDWPTRPSQTSHDLLPLVGAISPEDSRQPGEPGADSNNRGEDLNPRSKVFDQP
jgi:hypothetical protein